MFLLFLYLIINYLSGPVKANGNYKYDYSPS